MIRRPPRSTPLYSSAASDVYKRQSLFGRLAGVDDASAAVVGTRGCRNGPGIAIAPDRFGSGLATDALLPSRRTPGIDEGAAPDMEMGADWRRLVLADMVAADRVRAGTQLPRDARDALLSLIHISEPTRLGMIS